MGDSSKKKYIIIIAAVVLIVGGVLAVMYLKDGKMRAVKKYYSAMEKSDAQALKDACYPEEWQAAYDSYAVSLDEVATNAFTLQAGVTYDDITYVTDYEVESDYCKLMADGLKDLFSVDMEISSIRAISFDITYTAEDGSSQDSGTITRYIYKYGSRWYYLSDPYMSVYLGLDG